MAAPAALASRTRKRTRWLRSEFLDCNAERRCHRHTGFGRGAGIGFNTLNSPQTQARNLGEVVLRSGSGFAQFPNEIGIDFHDRRHRGNAFAVVGARSLPKPGQERYDTQPPNPRQRHDNSAARIERRAFSTTKRVIRGFGALHGAERARSGGAYRPKPSQLNQPAHSPATVLPSGHPG